MRIHPVISVTQLKPVPMEQDPYQREAPEPTRDLEAAGSDQGWEPWQIDQILSRRKRPDGGYDYLIRWNHDMRPEAWQPQEQLVNAKDILDAYDAAHPRITLRLKNTAKASAN